MKKNSKTINEQFSPLFKIDMTWKAGLLTKFEIKRSRILAYHWQNQITETGTQEYVFGVGYRVKDVELSVFSRKRKKISSDLDLKILIYE